MPLEPEKVGRLTAAPNAATDLLESALVDAFGRIRVSSSSTIFDSKQIYDDEDPLFFDQDLTATGTAVYNNARASTLLSVTADGDVAIRQTHRYFNYQGGKSQMIAVTSIATDGAETNVAKRIGYFDVDNGIFLNVQGGNIQLVRRSNTSGAPVNVTVAQASWSLDPMDGTGTSGITLDFSLAQILIIDFQWLGTGRVRVGFDIAGIIVYAHEFLNANILDVVYMQTPNLPVRWEIEKLGALAGTQSLEAVCCSVVSESGFQPVGVTRSADRGDTAQVVGAGLEPLITIRLQASFNRATVFPQKLQVMASSGANTRWVLAFNPTVTGGAAAAYTAVSNSAVEFDVARNGVLNEDGTTVASGYMANNEDSVVQTLESVLTLASNFAGTPDELVLGAENLGGGNENLFAALSWLEVT